MRVPLVDLAAQHHAINAELRAAIDRVLASNQFILGPEVERFESELACYVGAAHAVAVSSGTDALLVSLLALGVGPGDEVVTTPFTFFATVEAIARVGATPRFADLETDGLALDPELVEAAISPRTRAVVAVHLFGMPADLDRLGTAARAHGLPLIEDAAQALGAEYHGRKAGSWGTVGCFSFFPAKPLGALGDGGMIVTSDETLFLRCRQLRVHGAAGKHTHHAIGGNFRLDALQAAVLRAKLPHLQGWLRARRQHAAAYDAAFATLTGLVRPPRRADCEGSFSHYTVRVRAGRRNALAEHLRARGVASAVHYPRPLHLQPALAHLRIAAGSLPESERAAREVLSLPLYPELSLEQRKHVIAAVREFFG